MSAVRVYGGSPPGGGTLWCLQSLLSRFEDDTTSPIDLCHRTLGNALVWRFLLRLVASEGRETRCSRAFTPMQDSGVRVHRDRAEVSLGRPAMTSISSRRFGQASRSCDPAVACRFTSRHLRLSCHHQHDRIWHTSTYRSLGLRSMRPSSTYPMQAHHRMQNQCITST